MHDIAGLDDAEPSQGTPLAIGLETLVWTERSCWLFRPGFYMRVPLAEAPRGEPGSPRLRDREWMGQHGVTWETDDDASWWLRVRPTEGPVGGQGIGTGLVQRVAFR